MIYLELRWFALALDNESFYYPTSLKVIHCRLTVS
jgi:hypothetical protein